MSIIEIDPLQPKIITANQNLTRLDPFKLLFFSSYWKTDFRIK